MKKLFVLLILLPFNFYAQSKEVIPYPKGKLFLGAEIGGNSITSYTQGERELFIHGGFLAEYYFAKRWSISMKAKYFKVGTSFYKPDDYVYHPGGFLWGGYSTGSPERSGRFDGEVIHFPLYLKWQFRICKNLIMGLKAGPGLAIETNQAYTKYSSYIDTNFKKQYMSINKGLEINYFIDKKTMIYVDFEKYIGASKGEDTTNDLTSIGVKYSFMD